ncbi:serine-rich adhesin for platelets [Musca vetustissima]|uniref:serine-rich adhesin for platelets n=1 Tax=Musca vetustissima TaxID=27455 RepID=UPI002AB71E1A|nr:serine-rich adhesin for platelets [Musca vetustissima]
MPFVQRVVQPVNLAQVCSTSGSGNQKANKFLCIPGKCQNNNCINNKLSPQHQQQQQRDASLNGRENPQQNRITTAAAADSEFLSSSSSSSPPPPSLSLNPNDVLLSRTASLLNSNAKDGLISPSLTSSTTASSTTTVTTAIIHNNGGGAGSAIINDLGGKDTTDHVHNNGGFASSFSYNTDHEDDGCSSTILPPVSPAPTMPMKKLKQHVEFLSNIPTSPTRQQSVRGSNSGAGSSSVASSSGAVMRPSHTQQQQRLRTPQSPTAAKIVAGYEFDSISNITLSNALRQLASLVLIASDIFDDLQKELQSVGDRARVVQKKIIAVERRVSAYDPKMVTVPESDLLTFAQRKQHYESDKSHRKELFTSDTRPHSVRVLYEEAGKVTPPPTPATGLSAASTVVGSPTSAPFDGILSGDEMADMVGGATANGGGANLITAGSDDDDLLLCPFGNSSRKMRKRIDAEIEIRLPAAIEDLRKWTSSEALGDVTVTPDCMHHVDTSISTSVVIGDNGVLTPALSPSVLSADAVDALYSIDHNNTLIDNSHIPNDINNDVPLNHRLPSPEEQCKIIALRYPAEVISVDTSGKRFQRMCMARKSTTGVFTTMPDTNNLNDDVQTVARRSRSRKARGKRRNTIAGIDQKEIQSAANGDTTATSGELKNALASTTDADGNGDAADQQQHSRATADLKASKSKFGRSKSSDLLKKESVALPYDKGKSTLTRLNSLKQWGRNRFKFMQRSASSGDQHNTSTLSTINSSGCSGSNDLNTSGGSTSASHNTSSEKAEICSASGSASVSSSHKTLSSTTKMGEKSSVTDVDEDCRVHEYVTQRAHESRFSHERKPSYSSSEKSMSVSSSGHLRGKLHLNSACANVKLRDTSSLNRQRRINGLGGGGNNKDDQPHSSSGNWSASSESGRASIGSEITLQPKSSASNTSLNVSSFQNGSSNPPSSMLSRRRFFNTSASSSVTSEGTATPDLQMANEGAYPNHLDDETSSAYSCDTEGYYTSFHMDSGLRTLKEEEINMSNFQIGGHPLNASIFGQQQQQQQQSSFSSSPQTLMAENEYELFGRGSTSTTTSSAGTVCTTLMAHNSGAEQSSLNNSLASCGPEVPERVSSLRLSSASTSTLERSISSSTIGSTLERTGTIKRNVNASLKLSCNEVPSLESNTEETPESQDDEFNFNEQIKKRGALPLPTQHSSEVEVSECSDLEGVERIERIKQKTAMTARRIPSMCIITPSTSDDENHHLDDYNGERHQDVENGDDDDHDEDDVLNKTLTEESFKDLLDEEKEKSQEVDNNLNHVKAAGENLSLFEKLKVILPPSVKKSPKKAFPTPELSVINDDELYDMSGEYVYISADVSNNNNNSKKASGLQCVMPKAPVSSSLGIYYSSNVLKMPPPATEYVSLNELPKTIQKAYAKESPAVLAASSNTMRTKAQEGSFTAESENKQRSAVSADSDKAHNSMSSPGGAMAMYAEINELRSEIAASAGTAAATTSASSSTSANATTLSYLQNTPPSSASSSPHVSPHKGARVRLNAQGKPIYDSDSLKRRKGAHTTFAPGPYVKRQADGYDGYDSNEYSDIKRVGEEENESVSADTTLRNNTSAASLHSSTSAAVKSESVLNPVAKLLLLNKSNANPRKIANVRPIVHHQNQHQKLGSPSMRPLPLTPYEQQNNATAIVNNSGATDMYASSSAAYAAIYSDATTTNNNNNKHLTANQTNPYFHQPQSASMMMMMHSPSTKSTASSTGSTISSSTGSSSISAASVSTTTTTNSGNVGGGVGPVSSAKDDEGYQHLYKSPDEVDGMIQPYYETLSQSQNQAAASTFQRNSPLYWTLQNRRPVKPQAPANALSRDDLYATPLKRSERLALAQQQQQQRQQAQQAAAAAAEAPSSANLPASPSAVRQRTNTNFHTSTPIRNSDSELPADNIPAKQRLRNWDDNSPERLNTCADRIGQSKTSLMDFKRLLLAKSAKSSTLPKKMSAVELLKKNNLTNQQNSQLSAPLKSSSSSTGSNPISITGGGSGTLSQLNSSMKLLDLSGSPKTFANRRMLRQGQFGSPSKSFAPKLKTTRSNSLQRTDIMSTTIPEANSEEDHHHHHHSANSSLNTSKNSEEENMIDDESFNIKRNIFLQAEENNFMRSELRSSFGRNKSDAKPPMVSKVEPIMKPLTDSSNVAAGGGGISTLTSMMANVNVSNPAMDNMRVPSTNTSNTQMTNTAASLANMPALETAL